MSDLFDGVLAAGPVRGLVDDTAWLQAMLDFEAALAHAEAAAGVIDAADAGAIAAQCRAELYDAGEIGAAAAGIGNPTGPLVRALTARVGGEAARTVHFGATSQDVLDTATMLIARRVLDALVDELDACSDKLAALAERHAGSVQAGRSLLQQAPPLTFGLAVAGWLAQVDAAVERLADVREHRLAVQLGGAVGTLASLGERGPAVLAELARRLDLHEPALPWHTDRSRIAELAGALGQSCGAVAKIAKDVVLLAQTEVAEVHEEGGGAGGSSTMPHKRNPVAAIAASAAAAQAPGLVATLLAAAAHEHQRAAGAWHAEWHPLRELLRSTGSAVHWLHASLDRLRVDAERMRSNVDITGGALLAERITGALVGDVGRLAAHDAVADCCRRSLAGEGPLVDLLAADPTVGGHLDRERIVELLDPAGYLGSAGVFVERALLAHRKRRESS